MTGRSAVVGLVLATFALAGSLYVVASLVTLRGEALALELIAWAIVLGLISIWVARIRRRVKRVAQEYGSGGWAAATLSEVGPFMVAGAWVLPIAALALGLYINS